MKHSPPQATKWAGHTNKPGTHARHRMGAEATFSSQNEGGGGISVSTAGRTGTGTRGTAAEHTMEPGTGTALKRAEGTVETIGIGRRGPAKTSGPEKFWGPPPRKTEDSRREGEAESMYVETTGMFDCFWVATEGNTPRGRTRGTTAGVTSPRGRTGWTIPATGGRTSRAAPRERTEVPLREAPQHEDELNEVVGGKM